MLESGAAMHIDDAVATKAERVASYAIDHVHLRRYTMGDRQLEFEVLELFAAELPKTLAALRAAQTTFEWKVAAHTLKGSARAVGAWRIASAAVSAETDPLVVYDPISKAETVAACELAVRDCLAYICGLTAPA
jgi:HPt (histidine-containing phosphotransfer) domain-containing protein